MRYCGMGIRKESETCECTLSHFGLKPGSEITFVNEKISDITRPVSVKLKPQELKSIKSTSSTTRMSLPYKISETVFSVGHFRNVQFSLTGATK